MKLKEALITCVVCSVCLTPLLVNGETKKECFFHVDFAPFYRCFPDKNAQATAVPVRAAWSGCEWRFS